VSVQIYGSCGRRCGCRVSVNICTILRHSHRSSRTVSTTDSQPIFMAVVCTDTSASTVVYLQN
jgi:hypothetical protein